MNENVFFIEKWKLILCVIKFSLIQDEYLVYVVETFTTYIEKAQYK